jgi:hypothetical protein
MPILLENRGLRVFSGIAVLTVSSVRPSIRSVVGSIQINPSLDEFEGQVVTVSYAVLSPGISTLEVLIEAKAIQPLQMTA